jgi:myo-inositol-1(or 4)-monophosphatase
VVDELLALATRLAADAGALLLEGLAESRITVATKSSPTDVVTAFDRSSERLITEALRLARPGDAILGEEGTHDPGTTGVRWLIDPLDGTVNFLYGLPVFAVSIAAEVDGTVEVGVVAVPAQSETFTAVRGRGAWLDGRPLVCTGATELSEALVGTGFSYRPERRLAQADMLATVLPSVRDIRRAGAAAIDLCWVGAGRLDAFYEHGLQPWDLAAGALVAAEAGAVVGDLEGGRPSSGLTVAAAPGIAAGFWDLLRRAGA